MRLLGPADMTTRPITDRAKESLFGILTPRLPDARVADLFCGTGSLGLEAISRGAATAIMVDRQRDALDRLRENIAKLCFEDCTTVVQRDIFRHGLPHLRHGWGPEEYDLVFIDPPYSESQDGAADSKLAALLLDLGPHVSPGGLAIVRHAERADVLTRYGDLHRYDRRAYGNMVIDFLEKTGGPAPQEDQANLDVS